MLKDVFNKITNYLTQGEEVEFSIGGSYSEIIWEKNPLDEEQTFTLEMYINKKDEIAFHKVEKEVWIEAYIKYAKAKIKVKLSDLESLVELTKGKEIQAFHLVVARSFGKKFEQPKNFITQIERMILEYYQGIVQYAKSWNRPTPKIVND